MRRYREIRDREAAQAKGPEEQQPAAPEAAPEAETEDAGDDEPVVSEEKPVEKPKQTVKLKVHGKEEEVSLDDAIALAQIAKASDNMFNEAKRLLKLAEEQARSPRSSEQPEHQPGSPRSATTQPNPSEGQPAPEHQPVAGLDPEKLAQIAERIQVGDAAEGAEALQELITEIAGKASKPSVTPEEIDQRVETRLRHQRTQEELDSAYKTFESEFPDVIARPLLRDAGLTALRSEMVKDLRAAGLTDEQIEHAAQDNNRLVSVHRDLRSRNKDGVRSYSEVFKATGKLLYDEFGFKPKSAERSSPPKAPTPPRAPIADPAKLQERIERKRAAPQQPRAAGVRAPVAAPPQQKSPRDVIEMMRRSRGFSPTR